MPEQVWGQYATGDGSGLRQYPNQPTADQPLVSGVQLRDRVRREADDALRADDADALEVAIPVLEAAGDQRPGEDHSDEGERQ